MILKKKETPTRESTHLPTCLTDLYGKRQGRSISRMYMRMCICICGQVKPNGTFLRSASLSFSLLSRIASPLYLVTSPACQQFFQKNKNKNKNFCFRQVRPGTILRKKVARRLTSRKLSALFFLIFCLCRALKIFFYRSATTASFQTLHQSSVLLKS